MIESILLIIIILCLALGGGAAVWFIFRQRLPVKERTTKEGLRFHWRYIVLPLVILLLSAALSAYFYHLLPAEVAYNFKPDSSPDNWLSRDMTIVWMLVPQILLTLLAAAITWGITKLGIPFGQPQSFPIKLESVLSFMGNVVALPQIIFLFALADIFSYNSYHTHIMPLWAFALIIALVGAVILGVFFILAFQRARRAT